jgi:phosphoglycolate phosphatase-like HAD superfamily hydrolase
MTRKLLVCDLDNTLYDWVSYFVPSFYAMVDRAVEITGCDRNKLLDEFRVVHQKYHDSEQPFALLETQTVTRMFADAQLEDVAQKLDPAFHAFNSERKQNLRLHPGVRETLTVLSRYGIKLVAHTESKLYGAADRLDRLGLFEFFQRIYCRERSVSTRPRESEPANWLDRFPMEKITELSLHQTKPNPMVLLEICSIEGVVPEEAAYIGDSIARDVLMAKRAGVFAVWAAYGAEHSPTMYDALVRISHWTPEEVERERQLREEAKLINPDLIAHREFAEVLGVFGLPANSMSA